MIIDSHVHFWQFDPVRDTWITRDMAVLQQDYLPKQLIKLFQSNDVDGVVAVQADQSEAETLFLCRLAEDYNVIKGVVGWIDLCNERVMERLEFFATNPIIKGWRHIVQAEPDNFLKNKAFLQGIQCINQYHYTYDILIYPSQLPAVIEFIHHFPQQKFVIDHAAKPEIKAGNIREWSIGINELAKNEHVYCKLSGLFTETQWQQWKEDEFYPYFDILFECFGAERLMMGSDWPVLLLSGQYSEWKRLLEGYIQKNCPHDYYKIMGENAIKFYNI